MRRGFAIWWQGLSFLLAAALYFVFVLPRWWELTEGVSHGVGTTLRIVAGAVLALTALPVAFTLIRTRRPEFGTPQLALSLRVWSIVAHVLAGVLILGTAIAEIWLDLDSVGQWLFGVYGGAAAIAILGAVAFYLSFVAEMPPPPPKPLKPKKAAPPREEVSSSVDESESDDTEVADAADLDPDADTDAEVEADEKTPAGLRNRRPSGKTRAST